MSMFDRPATPGRPEDSPNFNNAEHLGDLLVLQVREIRSGVETEYGPKEVTVATVHVIDPAGTIRQTYPDAYVWGEVLKEQVRDSVGRNVLGVLELGEKRPGKKPPYRLADPTPEQEAAAVRAMTSGPAPAVPEPTPAPFGAGGTTAAAVNAAPARPWG